MLAKPLFSVKKTKSSGGEAGKLAGTTSPAGHAGRAIA